MKQKSIILVFLIAIICMLAVGYAAFSTQLITTGTASISSKWDIQITNIDVTNVEGSATKAIEPVISGTTATFKTNLVSPGDSMTYTVTVTNKGNVDAKVSSIEMTDSNNPAITFQTQRINKNDLLQANQSQTFDVIVSYNSKVTSQPDIINSTLSLKLNYIQNA